MFQKMGKQVLDELSVVLSQVDEREVDQLAEAIVNARRIVTTGAGRMGMMARAFAMRLSHLNLQAYHISDCNTPRVGKGDLLLVCSGSGETKTIVSLATVAKSYGTQIGLVTARRASTIQEISDVSVFLPAATKIQEDQGFLSIQPMTSLTEQSCLMFLDILVLILMDRLQQTHEMLKSRHSILE